MENGVDPKWGLSETGEAQAKAAGQRLRTALGEGFDCSQLRIYASPFSRTMQTAQLASEQLALSGDSPTELVPEPDLRERHFGSFELMSDASYPTVWAQDTEDIDSRPTPDGQGETVSEVSARLQSLLSRLEARHSGNTILLVAHGDITSILATSVASDGDLKYHRSSGYYLDTGGLLCLDSVP